MKKARNLIGAVAIALAFVLNPAPVESAAEGQVQIVREACTLLVSGKTINVPFSVAEILHNLGIADCPVFRHG